MQTLRRRYIIIVVEKRSTEQQEENRDIWGGGGGRGMEIGGWKAPTTSNDDENRILSNYSSNLA